MCVRCGVFGVELTSGKWTHTWYLPCHYYCKSVNPKVWSLSTQCEGRAISKGEEPCRLGLQCPVFAYKKIRLPHAFRLRSRFRVWLEPPRHRVFRVELSVQLPGETNSFVVEMCEASNDNVGVASSGSGEQETQDSSSAISGDLSGGRSKVNFATHSDETEEMDRKMTTHKSTIPSPEKCLSRPTYKERKNIPTLLAMDVAIPTQEERKKRLKDNLGKMGCASLMEVPWSLRKDSMLREFLTPPKDSGQCGKPVRSDWSKFTVETIGKAFGLRWTSESANNFLFWQNGTDEPVRNDYFLRKSPSDEGYKVDDCLNDELRDILLFLGPILYSMKPKFLPLYLLNTIILSWRGTREVVWGAVLFSTLDKLIQICHRKQTRLGPFLY